MKNAQYALNLFKKLFHWLKHHLIISAIGLVFVVFAMQKLTPIVFYKFFMKQPMMHVETIVLKERAAKIRWQAVGTVKASQDVVISSEVSGTVQDTVVANGQAVKQGTVLLNIRHDDISANLQRDQAILTQKQRYYERLQRLYKTNAVSQEALSEAWSAYSQAEAAVKADQALLDKYIIKAPFSGVLGIWQVGIGQFVRPGDALITLTNLSPAHIDFMLPAKALPNIKVGDEAFFTTASYPDYIWRGRISAIEPQLDKETRSIKMRATIDNNDGKLVPHLYGQIVVMQTLTPQLFIPQEAVIYDPKGASVYVLRQSRVAAVPVMLGVHEGNDVMVVSGLKAGDEVITAGMMKVFPGMSVMVNKKVIQTSVAQPTTESSSTP